MRGWGALLASLALVVAVPSGAAAQLPGLSPPPPGPVTPKPSPPAPSSGTLHGPRTIALGVAAPLRGAGAAPGVRVEVQIRRRGRWRRLVSRRSDRRGRYRVRARLPFAAGRYRLRAVAPQAVPSRTIRVRTRGVTLDAVGDINLGDGVADVMARRGTRFPWGGVRRELRSADIAFGNLECAVSTRGRKVPDKQYNFRGRPGALRSVARYAGMDVLNMANNHSGDFGTTALLDTMAWVGHFGMKHIGAGRGLPSAGSPQIVRRLGLRVAFVGFSDINPAGFVAGPHRPGTLPATPAVIRHTVRRARRRADVVIASFHWGVERETHPTGRQRALARSALAAGAGAVIGAHPHVLQPIRKRGRKLIAYSLGNFVWSAGSGVTARTGILRLRLSRRGVERSTFLHARIAGTRPGLTGR
jgi:capsule synthesis protein PGA_cap